MGIKETEECNGCGICRENCDFLKKYDLTIGDVQKLSEKAYHCFLCGKCTAVCPKGIDGRAVMLQLRQTKTAENNGKPDTRGLRFMIAEKSDYRYKNDSAMTEGSVLFPGCNFSAYYPKTTAYLMDLMKQNGIGTLIDCCGKPIAELGMQQQEQMILDRLTAKLKKGNVREVIMVCPNCYYFLKDRIPVRVVSIYEKLTEFGIKYQPVDVERIFLPCPDRQNREWLDQIRMYIQGDFEEIGDGSCCGLGGCGYVTERKLSGSMAAKINDQAKGKAYVYCASCAGKIGAAGSSEILHLLPEILGTEEKCDRVHAWKNKRHFARR